MAPRNPRVTKAFGAMKDLGITEDKVKPILKSLLKAYDKNWAPIEEENYRVLIEAIFENEEAEASKNKQMDNTNNMNKMDIAEREQALEVEDLHHDEAGRPLKRLRLKYADQASNSVGTSLVKPKDEPVELPEFQPQEVCSVSSIRGNGDESLQSSSHSLDKSKGKQPVSPNSFTVQERTSNSQSLSLDKSRTDIPKEMDPVIVPHQMCSRNKGKETLSPRFASGEGRLELKKSSPAVSSQRNDCEPKEEPFTGDISECLPLAVIHPESSNAEDSTMPKNSSGRQNGAEPLALEPLARKRTNDDFSAFSRETKTNSDVTSITDESTSQLQVAASALGEVNISVSCNMSSLGPDFRTPSLDDLVKMVEDRCLRTYKILDKNFSVMKIMKDMCECFVELGSESCHESEKTVQVKPRIDLLSKFPSQDPLVGGPMHFDYRRVSDNAQSDNVGDLPKVLPLPSPDDTPGAEKDANGEVNVDNGQNELSEATCKSLVVVRQLEVTPDQIQSLHDVFDISKGQERVKITLDRGNIACLPSFHYIPQNAVFQNAYINFSLARIGDDNCCSSCFGDCLSSATPCVCAIETGTKFAYTSEGLVKEEFLDECISMNRDPKKHCQYLCKECPLERSKNGDDVVEPCKGHLVRKFIKECWWKCGCSKSCGNRVVQRGITHQLQVFMTEGKGWGLRTLEDLPKGAFVCEYVGEILTNAELFDRVSRSPKGEVHSYPVLLDADWGCERVLKDEEALCLDATFYGNVARFINHRCFDSNMVEIPVEIETPDHHYYHLAFFTTREVRAMEELTWDYGIDFDDVEHPVKAFRCHCGSRFCRNIRRPSSK
ncbi:OLC1v1006935C1 [Oldenlandia corymbosa var. corymbosa]|uniref:OLC1v1006935C1 n=1 Tax=Oldenlandia corymbosa var. corymbosa TaxID=529605 RepID=A0AAV1DI32_OLDCO|nr:OLC1v1006935C1 [Oldenlandia corymbosa var. corymbosa]